MENTIKFHYDLDIKSIKQENDICIITDNKNTYYLVPYIRPIEDLKDLVYVSEELLKKNIANHTFIPNKKNQIVTTINELNYVLLRINYLESFEFNLTDIMNFNQITSLNIEKSNLYRNDWANLWSEKVDYFEYQVAELGKNKKIILDSFSYYIGLAENAISYVNEVQRIYKDVKPKIVLSRKRIYYPNYSINYLNPITYIFDLEIRDIAEYIKSKFMADEDVWGELDIYFKKTKLEPYMYNMFFARLLYPSYYFDIYEKIMNKGEDESALIDIIDKNEYYEDFLQEMYYYLSNFSSIIPIDWIRTKVNCKLS